MKAATEPPAPGMQPSKVPIAEPISCGRQSRRQVRKLGSLILVSAPGLRQAGRPAWIISSLTANTPTMIRIGSMPPSSSGRPKVKRLHARLRIAADHRDHQAERRR